MAITRAKITIFFQSAGGSGVPGTGWTETWFTGDTDYQTLLDRGVQYAKYRKELLGVGATVTAVRASDDTIKRDTLFAQITGKDGQSSIFTNSPDDDYDPTQVDLLVRVQGGPLQRRSWQMSGLPDSVTDQLKVQGVSGAFVNSPAYKTLIKYMMTNQFKIKVKDRNNPGQFILVDITDFVPRMVRNRKRGRPFDQFRGRR